jgi:EAL domain-containing protein (putative c-di-GMP-specific phosphodiesterase class I)
MGLLLPEAFVAAGHECDMLGPLTDWLVQRLCDDLQFWQDQGRQCPPLILPCSSRLLLDADFLAAMNALIKEQGFKADMLVLGLRERVVTEATTQLLVSLRQLAQLGLRFALTEFGQGRCIPLQLQSFPVQSVLVSRELVEQSRFDRQAEKLLAALIPFCQTLGVSVVADGVEHPEQEQLLRNLGCEQGQGSFFSLPLGVNKITELLPTA